MNKSDIDRKIEEVGHRPGFLKELVFDYLEQTSGGDHNDFAKYLFRITDLCDQYSNDVHEAKVLKSMLSGIEQYLSKNYVSASEIFTRLIESNFDLNESNIKGIIHFLYGRNLCAQGELELGLAQFVVAQGLVNPHGILPTYYELLMFELGELSCAFGQFEDARFYYHTGIECSTTNKKRNGRFELYCGLAGLHRKQNELNDARRCLDEALINSSSAYQRSKALHELGAILLELKCYDDALSCAENSHSLRSKGRHEDAVTSKILIGKIHLALKNYSTAISILKETLSITVLFKSSLNEAEIHMCLFEAYEAVYDKKRAVVQLEDREKIKNN